METLYNEGGMLNRTVIRIETAFLYTWKKHTTKSFGIPRLQRWHPCLCLPAKNNLESSMFKCNSELQNGVANIHVE